MKKIGILGGISCESTGAYYDLIHKKYFEQFGDYYYPEVILYSLNFQKFTDLENQDSLDGYREYILEGLRALENAGADFIIMAANSPHSVYDSVSKGINIPILSIAEVTAMEAENQNLSQLLLLGIKHTMQSDFYQKVCQKYDIEVLTPKEEEQNHINTLIFDELCRGNFSDEVKAPLIEIIQQYDVDGVILGCTELPLILKQGDTDLHFLNTLDIHVNEALKLATVEK